MNQQTLSLIATSPAAFRGVVRVRNGEATLAESLVDFQREALTLLDPCLVAISQGKVPPRQGMLIEWPKGSAKTSIAGQALAWLLMFSRRTLEMRAGAGDLEQAAEVRQVLRDLVRENAWMGDMLEINNWAVTNKHNGSLLQIVASDAKTGHGGRPDVTFVDELVHISDEHFVDTLLANQSKKPGGFTLICSNAGFLGEFHFRKREVYRQSEDWHFHRHASPPPWITRRTIEATGLLPTSIRRLYYSEWQSGSGDAIDGDDIQAAVTQAGPMTGKEQGFSFYAGLDLAARKDCSALCVVGLSRQRLRLAHAEVWAPKRGIFGKAIDLAAVKKSLIETHRRFRFVKVFHDGHDDSFVQDCIRAGLPMELVPFSSATQQAMMAAVVIGRFSGRTIDLYRHEQLLADRATCG